jgi:hypothetical protein
MNKSYLVFGGAYVFHIPGETFKNGFIIPEGNIVVVAIRSFLGALDQLRGA